MLKAGEGDQASRLGDYLLTALVGFLLQLGCDVRMGPWVRPSREEDQRKKIKKEEDQRSLSKVWLRRVFVSICEDLHLLTNILVPERA